MAPTDSSFYDRPEIWSEHSGYASPVEHQRATTVADLVVQREPQRVLEVGAGNGLIANLLHDRGVDVLALDFSEVALEGVRGPRMVADIARLPFKAGSFDSVVASEVLEHLPDQVFEAAKREIARVAKSAIVVTVPNQEDLDASGVICPRCRCRSSAYRHVRSFGPGDLASLLHSFKAERVFTFGPRDVRHRRTEVVLRRDLLGRWPWPATAVCPQCGYREEGASSGEARAPGRAARLARPARTVRPRWLGAVLLRR